MVIFTEEPFLMIKYMSLKVLIPAEINVRLILTASSFLIRWIYMAGGKSGLRISKSKAISNEKAIEMINNVNGRLGDFSGLTNPYYFLRSRKIPRKDLVLAETNKRLQFFTVSAEGIRLDGGKDLLGIQIIDFCNKKPEEEGYVQTSKNHYQKQIDGGILHLSKPENFYPVCYGYVFWVIGNIKDAEKTLALSLDKRINPTKAYVKLGKDIYEIDLKGGEGEK